LAELEISKIQLADLSSRFNPAPEVFEDFEMRVNTGAKYYSPNTITLWVWRYRMNALDWLAESLTDMIGDVEDMGLDDKTRKLKRALLRAFNEACAASRELRHEQERQAASRPRRNYTSARPGKGMAA
jgi:hypothetical protein